MGFKLSCCCCFYCSRARNQGRAPGVSVKTILKLVKVSVLTERLTFPPHSTTTVFVWSLLLPSTHNLYCACSPGCLPVPPVAKHPSLTQSCTPTCHSLAVDEGPCPSGSWTVCEHSVAFCKLKAGRGLAGKQITSSFIGSIGVEGWTGRPTHPYQLYKPNALSRRMKALSEMNGITKSPAYLGRAEGLGENTKHEYMAAETGFLSQGISRGSCSIRCSSHVWQRS